MTTITRTMLDEFRKEFAKSVVSLETKYGLKIQLGSIAYSPDGFHTKLEAKTVADSGEPYTPKDKRMFEENCWLFGLDAEMFGKSYRHNGITMTVVGLNTRAPKNCVELLGSDGKRYKCPPTTLKYFLKSQEVI